MNKIKRSISMYSLQDNYARGKMSLEDIFQFVDKLDTGIELISDQMIKNSPNPSKKTLEEWDELVGKYNPDLVCNDIFINTCLYKNRTLTTKESVNLLKDEIRVSDRLGFRLVRLVSQTPPEIIEPALDTAIKHDVILTLEIHGGMSFDHPMSKKFIDVMKELNSPYVGLTIDAGIFCRRHPRVATEYFRKLGTNNEVIEYIDNIFEKGTDPKRYFEQNSKEGEKWPEDLKKLIKSENDALYATFADGYEASDFEILDEYMDYIKHFHGKIYEMTENGVEYSIPYDELIKYLSKKKYNGYISTEYEGNRFTLPEEKVKEKENVIKHQEMLKKYIEKY